MDDYIEDKHEVEPEEWYAGAHGENEKSVVK